MRIGIHHRGADWRASGDWREHNATAVGMLTFKSKRQDSASTVDGVCPNAFGTSSMLIATVSSRPNGSDLLATEMQREATELKKAHILFTSREFGQAGRQTNK